MTQKQFFSLFISCMIVVSKYTIIATECYQCDSAHHENCTLDWTEEDVRGNTYDQYIQQCTSLCTQKIVFENDSVNIWRYCEVTTFNGCNDQKDSCMFHCKDSKCNGVLSKWIPHTKEEALEHVYNGPRASSEKWRVTWTIFPLIITTQIIFN